MSRAEYEFNRDLCNHHMMFGSYSIVRKSGRGWWVSFGDQGFPSPFKTRKDAAARGDAWVSMRFAENREADAQIEARGWELAGPGATEMPRWAFDQARGEVLR